MFWAQRTRGTEMRLLHPCPLKGSDSTQLVDLAGLSASSRHEGRGQYSLRLNQPEHFP